jgi:hypothetical protein
MSNLQEDQRTAATGFLGNVGDSRQALNRVADAQGMMHFDAPAGVQTPRQRDRRKKQAETLVPVGAKR